MRWQYQWCDPSSPGTFGPFEAASMIQWRDGGVFAAHPARVRRCDVDGHPFTGEQWQPAMTAEFNSNPRAEAAVAAASDADSNGNVTRTAARDARDAGALSKLWWELSRPRKRGKIPEVPGHDKLKSINMFQQWLAQRQLEGKLEQEKDQQGFQVYRFTENTLTFSQQNGWDIAFHGTRWYALGLILHSGVMLNSDNKDAGHDFWEPGVYCTPVLSTARWYGIPHILFGDDIYHRVVMELRVNPAMRKRSRERGGVQWVFPSEATVIRAIWVQSNAPPDADERRFVFWDPDLEALPPGGTKKGPIYSGGPMRRMPINEDHSQYYDAKQKILDSVRNPPKFLGGFGGPGAGGLSSVQSAAQQIAARLAARGMAPPAAFGGATQPSLQMGLGAQAAPPAQPSQPAGLSQDLIQNLLSGPLNGVSASNIGGLGQQPVQNSPPSFSGLSPQLQEMAKSITQSLDAKKSSALTSVGIPAQPASGSLTALLAGGAQPGLAEPLVPGPQAAASSLEQLLLQQLPQQGIASSDPNALQSLLAGNTRPAPTLPENSNQAKRMKFAAFAQGLAAQHAKRGP